MISVVAECFQTIESVFASRMPEKPQVISRTIMANAGQLLIKMQEFSSEIKAEIDIFGKANHRTRADALSAGNLFIEHMCAGCPLFPNCRAETRVVYKGSFIQKIDYYAMLFVTGFRKCLGLFIYENYDLYKWQAGVHGNLEADWYDQEGLLNSANCLKEKGAIFGINAYKLN